MEMKNQDKLKNCGKNCCCLGEQKGQKKRKCQFQFWDWSARCRPNLPTEVTALNRHWAALCASGHKELRKGGDTIPCTFSKGVAVALLCTSPVFPGIPYLLGIKYVLELPRKMLSPYFFIFLCIPSMSGFEESGFAISKSCSQDSSSLTGKSKSKEVLQSVDKTEFGKVSITACTTEGHENDYILGTQQQLTV